MPSVRATVRATLSVASEGNATNNGEECCKGRYSDMGCAECYIQARDVCPPGRNGGGESANGGKAASTPSGKTSISAVQKSIYRLEPNISAYCLEEISFVCALAPIRTLANNNVPDGSWWKARSWGNPRSFIAGPARNMIFFNADARFPNIHAIRCL